MSYLKLALVTFFSSSIVFCVANSPAFAQSSDEGLRDESPIIELIEQITSLDQEDNININDQREDRIQACEEDREYCYEEVLCESADNDFVLHQCNGEFMSCLLDRGQSRELCNAEFDECCGDCLEDNHDSDMQYCDEMYGICTGEIPVA